MSRTAKRTKSKRPKSKERVCPKRFALLFLTHLLALVGLLHPSVQGFSYFLIFYVFTGCFGLTVGYHRLLTHRSFQTPSWIRNILAYLGTLCLQGGPTLWAAYHRMHHTYTDKSGDPHASSRGFFWSHIYWMINKSPNGFSFRKSKNRVSDVANTPWIKFLDENYFLVNFLTALFFFVMVRDPYVVLWAFPVRIVAFWHATWLVNSFAHFAGHKKRKLGSSRNSFWLSVIMFGEGWHHNHHTTPSRASFQGSKWDWDPGYYSILALEKANLAKRIKR